MTRNKLSFKELTSKIGIFLFSFEFYINNLSVEIGKDLCRGLFIKECALQVKKCIFVNN
jgi:hypothetical protein